MATMPKCLKIRVNLKRINNMKLLICLTFLVSLNVFAQSDVVSEVSEINQKLVLLSEVLEQTPYQKDQHEAIKSYFVSLKEFGEMLKDSPRLKQRFNNYLSNDQVKEFCS